MAFIPSFLTCYSAARANHIGGLLGVAVSGAFGWLVSAGYVQQARDFVCRADLTDLGLAVASIGSAAAILNSATTKALAPAQNAADAVPVTMPADNVTIEAPKVDNAPHNSDLERVKMPFPVPRKR